MNNTIINIVMWCFLWTLKVLKDRFCNLEHVSIIAHYCPLAEILPILGFPTHAIVANPASASEHGPWASF